MKAFFAKVWAWIVAHKIIAIATASVVVIGTALAIILPSALHDHTYSDAWSADAENHWHAATCKHEEEKSDLAAHTYTNACDTTCDVCGYARTAGAHVYDNACDTACNVCGATRTTTHNHADTLTAGETTHWYACSACGDKKDEAAHVYNVNSATSETLKAPATATTKAQYYKSCVCGAISSTEYFETDKALANLLVSDISKTYDGTPVAEPTVTFDGVGAENFAYYEGTTLLSGRPTNAGTYKVVVTVDETDTHAGDRVEREFTIAKKIIGNLNLSAVYNGETYFEIVYTNADLADIAAGDTLRLEIGTTEKNVGEYTSANGKLEEIIADGDNSEMRNYEVDATTCTFTVVKKVLSNLSFEFIYDKSTAYDSQYLTEAQGIAAADVEDGIFVFVQFDGEIVGSTVTGAELDFGESSDSLYNYELDTATLAARIVPKTLNIVYGFEYNGIEFDGVASRQAYLTNSDNPDILPGDEVLLEAEFAGADVGSAITTENFEPGISDTFGNYTTGSCTVTIVPAKLRLKTGEALTLSASYKKSSSFMFNIDTSKLEGYVGTAAQMTITATAPSDRAGTYDTGVVLSPYRGHPSITDSLNYDFSEITTATMTITKAELVLKSYVTVEYSATVFFTLNGYSLTSANTGAGQDGYVYAGDEVYLDNFTVSSAMVTDETFAIDYTLSGEDAENYCFDELGVQITKKKLTNLKIYITKDTYLSGKITLLAKDGYVSFSATVPFEFSITNYNEQDFCGDGNSLYLLLPGVTIEQGYETIDFVDAGWSDYYEFATYTDDYLGKQIVGEIIWVESCDVQYDGSCNCGTSHLSGEAKSADIITSVPCATTWNGGIYKITTEAGYWSILPESNFATITAIYDSKGNSVAIDGNDGFYAEKGTYYVHIGKASSLSSAQYIKFTYVNTLENLPDNGAAKSAVVSGNNGDIIFFRIEDDAPWGASMNIFSDDETTILDENYYTVFVYDEYFNLLGTVIYDGTDVYDELDDSVSVVGKTLYIAVQLYTDTDVQVYVY